MKVSEVISDLKRRFPNEPEYHQAVEEVLTSIEEVYNSYPQFERYNLIERLCVPDRILSFRVSWVDDAGNVRTNMGYRVQHNNAIGPYKGGIRFHASVDSEVPRFRTDFQELSDDSRNGWRQRRLRLLSQRKKRYGSHAFLSGFRA